MRSVAVAAPALSLAARAVLRTVLYASLFDYPLTLAELRAALIESALTDDQILAVYRREPRLSDLVDYRNGLFFSRGCGHLVEVRARRERASRDLLERHRTLLGLVCLVPFTRMVALSGSAAMLNCEDGHADLDLFIITRGPFVWSVTLAMVLLSKLLRRRKLLCVNFVIADRRLSLDQQDLFSANQIICLRPLIGADLVGTFVAANPFVARFYPNFVPPASARSGDAPGRALSALKRSIEIVLGCGIAQIVERCSRALYAWHLSRKSAGWLSPDQVRLGPDCLKLHTRSHRHTVLARFDQAVRDALGDE